MDSDFLYRLMHRYVISGLTLAAAIAAFPTGASAEVGSALVPSELWSAWSWEPAVVVALLVSGALYVTGVARLWSNTIGSGIRRWEVTAFAAGWVTLAIALISPLHELGGALFSAHMAQHELLIGVSTPLLVLGRPLIPFLWGLPHSWRRPIGAVTRRNGFARSWQFLSLPFVAFALHAIALWTWHLPGPYQSTLDSELMHTLQHSSFIFSALLFWWTIFRVQRTELGYGSAVFYLFATALQTGALGALLTFAPSLWYPDYATTTAAWGLTALEDQQLGGLIMWIPGSIPYVIAGLTLFARWLRESEARSTRRMASMLTVRTLVVLVAVVALSSCDRASGDDRFQLTDADAGRGKVAIRRYGCGSCHTIPGITGANALVGPPLAQIASRVYIGGVLPNEPDNLIRWIENPPAVDPKTVMPYMGVTPRDARDIAAYLYTLR
jgi:putative membrane protein